MIIFLYNMYHLHVILCMTVICMTSNELYMKLSYMLKYK